MDISQLNINQQLAVQHPSGPVILVAGAGTGKTTVITQRIAWLIEKGLAKPDEILALTFTDKASAEMEERVDKLLPLGYVDLWIQTFHAFCEKILKLHALEIGLPREFKLLDQTSAWILVRENLDKFNLDYYRPLGNPTSFIHALVNHFSRCKDEEVYPEDYLKYAEGIKLDSDTTGDREALKQEVDRLNEIANAYHVYQQLLLENNALDFGDLINYCLKLFKTREKILKQYRQQFKYILVDEFQDTNWAQYELVKLLVGSQQNIMVVGDDDQAIYKFRGASVSNILAFKKDFPKAAEIYLVDNYRSGQKILDSAYNFIQLNNPDRLEVKLQKQGAGRKEKGIKKLSKKLISHADNEGEIVVKQYATGEDEVRGVLEEIFKIRDSSLDTRHSSPSTQPRVAGTEFQWSDFAILSRNNEQAQKFVRYFRQVGIPHQFVAAKGLYTQEIILNILNYLKLLDNYHESPSLYKILAMDFIGLEPEDLVNLSHLANRKSWSLYCACKNYHGQITLSDKGTSALATVLNNLDKHKQLAEKISVSAVVYHFLEDSGYLRYLTIEETEETREQLLVLNQFYKKIRTWEDEHLGAKVHDFVEYINLELESGEAGKMMQDIEEGPDTVKIMTIHGAKGLEFKYVFIIGLVHLRFPSIERGDPIELPNALIKDTLPEGDGHLQEERRLMYVALTRAKEKVFLTLAEDYGGVKKRKPSRFLEELGIKNEELRIREVNQSLGEGERRKEQGARSKKKGGYKLPAKLSFTQLKAFETCPLQYYYAHVIKIPAKGSAVFSFGQTMHKTLQSFFSAVMERSGVGKQSGLFGTEARSKELEVGEDKPLISLKELLDMYETAWQDDWFFNENNKQEYFAKGKKILKEFYTQIAPKIPVPLFLEKGFNIKVGDYTIRGFIDRVDPSESPASPSKAGRAGKWKIMDYKTGKVKEKLTFEDKKQLLIYQLAAKDIFQADTESLMFYYLDENKPVAFQATEDDLTKVKQWIIDTADSMKQSDFSAKSGNHCKYCDFNLICPMAQK
ncbi:MAG: ATP-dependent DNA helicase [Candidatus Komeilibacteria bacterium]